MKNKRLVTLLVCVFLLVALAVVYVAASRSGEEDGETESAETTTETASNYFPFVDYTYDQMVSLQISWENNDYSFSTNDDGNWSAEGLELYNASSAITSLADSFCGLYASDYIDSEDYGEYGLSEPKMTIIGESAEGDVETFYIGSLTVGQDYYYILHEGDPVIYLLRKASVETFKVSYDALVDKTLTTLEVDYITYAKVTRPQGMGFEMDRTVSASTMSSYGLLSQLVMVEPMAGRGVYADNFSTMVIDYVNAITLGELVDLEINNEQYGFDNPSYELVFEQIVTDDDGNETASRFALTVGDDAGDGYYYCFYEENPHVYKLDKSLLSGIDDLTVFSLFDRFVNIVTITDVSGLELEYPDATYRFELNNTVVESSSSEASETAEPEESEESEPTYELTGVTLDGQALDVDSFKKFYQVAIGATYEGVIEETERTGEPVVTVRYNMRDGNVSEHSYYSYDNSFYLAFSEDETTSDLIVSKQYIDAIITYIEAFNSGE